MMLIVFGFVSGFGSPALHALDLPITILPTPNVDLTQPGQVRSLTRLSDGQWMVGGNFDRLGSTPRAGLGRLRTDGSVDPAFVPSSVVSSNLLRHWVSLPGGGSLVMHINRVRRLTDTGASDPAFTSLLFSPTNAESIAVVDEGYVVGGFFTQVLTTPATNVQRLAKFGLNGSLDTTFNIGSNGNVRVMRAIGPNDILIGGGFTEVGGLPRVGIARINTSGAGTVDPAFDPVFAQSGGSHFIEDIVVIDEAVYVVGRFTSVDGVPRSRAVKLSLATGDVDPNWNVAVGGTSLFTMQAFPHQSDLIISSGRSQTYANPPAAAITRTAVRVAQTSGVIDASFDPAFFDDGLAFIRGVPGDDPARLLIGGSFFQVDATQKFGVAQLDAAGRLDPQSGHAEAINAGNVRRLVFDEVNRRTYVSGFFLRAGAAARRYVMRLTPSGLVDGGWRAQTDDRPQPAMAVVPGTGVFVASNAGIQRLNESNGDQVAGWSNSFVANDLVVGGDALYALGSNNLVRIPLTGNGTADPGFVATLGSAAGDLVFDPIGNSLLLTTFVSQPGGGSLPDVVRLDASTGTRIAAFDPLLESNTGPVGSQGMAVDGDGVWIAGNFTRVNGVTRASPVRLRLADGQIDPNVAPSTGLTFNNGRLFHRGFFYGFRVTSGGAVEVRRVPATGGAADPTWILPANASVDAMAADGLTLLLGGSFDQLGPNASVRFGLAAALEDEGVFADGLE